MTKEEYLQQWQELKKVIEELSDKRNKLYSDYISQAPFQRGDKVKVYVKEEKQWNDRIIPAAEHICYIEDVRVGSNGNYSYFFHKSKKDGTESKFSVHYSYDRIEKLTS